MTCRADLGRGVLGSLSFWFNCPPPEESLKSMSERFYGSGDCTVFWCADFACDLVSLISEASTLPAAAAAAVGMTAFLCSGTLSSWSFLERL